MIQTMKDYISRLHAAVRDKRTAALVGIDPRWDQLPAPVIAAARQRHPDDGLLTRAAAYEDFSCRLIDVVAPLVPAIKPQAAFFEELGPPGTAALCRVIRRAREAGLLVICDAKRGDIGSTALAYAQAYLAGADPDAAEADHRRTRVTRGRRFCGAGHPRGDGLRFGIFRWRVLHD